MYDASPDLRSLICEIQAKRASQDKAEVEHAVRMVLSILK